MKFLGSTNRGFTLIELLVVISIIGLLSSVILASLGSARDKAKVSRVRSGVLELRKAIELGRSADGTYANLATSGANVCGNTIALADPNLTGIVNDVLSVTGKAFGSGTGPLPASSIGMVIYTDTYNGGGCGSMSPVPPTTNVPGGVPTRYAIFAALGPTTGSNGYVCVDSTGNSIASTTASFVSWRSSTPINFLSGGYCQ